MWTEAASTISWWRQQPWLCLHFSSAWRYVILLRIKRNRLPLEAKLGKTSLNNWFLFWAQISFTRGLLAYLGDLISAIEFLLVSHLVILV